LKILLSLPVIHEYQKSNSPSAKPLEGLERELQMLKNRLDSLIKKQGG
jgi:hypothetical protein